MIIFSVQKVIPSLVPHLFSMKIEEYQREGEIESEQDPVGASLGMKAFPYLPFLACRKKQVSYTFSEFPRVNSNSY